MSQFQKNPPNDIPSDRMLPRNPETNPVIGPNTNPKSIGIATVGLTDMSQTPGIVSALNGMVSAAYSAVPTAMATICFAEKKDSLALLNYYLTDGCSLRDYYLRASSGRPFAMPAKAPSQTRPPFHPSIRVRVESEKSHVSRPD